MKTFSATVSFFLFLLCSASVYSQQQAVFVIKNVTVITMTSPNQIIPNATVLIRGNIIESINGPISKTATVIDGTGKFLVPGLIDTHVHLPSDASFGPKNPAQYPDVVFNTQDLMTPIIANGVTTVVDLNSTVQTFAQKKEIEKGYVIGPRIALAALINGGGGQGRIANTPEEGRMLVKIAKTEGYDLIKVYSKLNIETFTAIVDEAHKLGIKCLGHIPDAFNGKIEQAFVPHFGMVVHAEEFSKKSNTMSEADAQRFASLSKANGTWFAPTLTTMVWIAKQTKSIEGVRSLPSLKYVHPLLQSKWLTANNYAKNASAELSAHFDSMVIFHKILVKSFKEAGVPILAGTDAGVSGVVAGFSLPDELELLVDAGLSTQEALASSTSLAAQWLGIDKQIGTVETGKLADLLLLDKNPLTDIKNVRSVSGVFVNGKWVEKSKLNIMLTDLAKRNNANKDKFDWKTITSPKK